MDSQEAASHIDVNELKKVIGGLDQGDVLDVAKLPTLYSPDSPAHPGEVEGIPHEKPVMTMEQLLPSRLSVVVSQTCDIRRLPDLEPYLLIAPLTSVDETTYIQAAQRLSVRYFAYPPIPGHEDQERLVVDARTISSLEKVAVLSNHLARIECPLPGPERDRLRHWLGQRFGRVAFPDEVANEIIAPIEKALRRVHERGANSAFFASVVYYGMAYTPSRPYCSLLLLTDPGLRGVRNVNEVEVENARNNLQRALEHWGRNSPYTVTATIHDATRVPASEMLQHHQLAIDLEAADLTSLP